MSCSSRRNVSVDSGRGSLDGVDDADGIVTDLEIDDLETFTSPPNTDIGSQNVDTDSNPPIESGVLQQVEGEEEVDFESIESQAVRSEYEILYTAVASLVEVLAVEFYTLKLIESEQMSKVQTQSMSDQHRAASTLLEAVMVKIKTSQSLTPFDHFIQVLHKHSSLHDIAVKIRAKHTELCTSHNTLHCQYPIDVPEIDSYERMMTEEMTNSEEIQYEMKELKVSTPNAGLVKRTDYKKRRLSALKTKVMHLTQAEIQKQLEKYGDQELELQIARKQIRQLNEKIVYSCRKQCYKKIEKAIENETLEYIATIQNLTQQREVLLKQGDY